MSGAIAALRQLVLQECWTFLPSEWVLFGVRETPTTTETLTIFCEHKAIAARFRTADWERHSGHGPREVLWHCHSTVEEAISDLLGSRGRTWRAYPAPSDLWLP